jgi:uncharacterized protein (DUF924 family)
MLLNMANDQHPIFEFWFGEISPDGEVDKDKQARWWKKSPEFDALCREHFEADVRAAARGELDQLKSSPRGYVSFILLCDQMPRNMFRDTPEAFAWDPLGLAACKELIESGDVLKLPPRVQAFALMPLMHSEEPEDQALAVEMFGALKERGVDNSDFALAHKKIIDQFGRFPHRNHILGRTSTAEEVEFLKGPGSSF